MHTIPSTPKSVWDPPSITPEWDASLLGYSFHCRSQGFSPRTFKNRCSALVKLAAVTSVEDPALVTKRDLQGALMRAYQERSGSGPRTFFNDLRAFFAWWSDDTGQPSPMTDLPRPKDIMPVVPVLEPDEIDRLLKVVSGRDWLSIRDKAAISVFLETGMRREELTALDLDDVDLRAGQLTVRRGKGGRGRLVPLGLDAGAALSKLMRNHPTKHGALFTNTAGRRLTGQMVGIMIRNRGEEAGISGLHPHRIRHSFVSYALEAGWGEHDVATVAGWSSTAQLARYGRSSATQRALATARAKPIMGAVRAR